MAEESKREVRLSVRVPQSLKDKIVAEAGRMGLSQSEFVRYILMTYFAEKEKDSEVMLSWDDTIKHQSW